MQRSGHWEEKKTSHQIGQSSNCSQVGYVILNLRLMTTDLTSKLCIVCTGCCPVKHVLSEKFLYFSLDQKLPSNSVRVNGYLTSVHGITLLGAMVSIRLTNV